MDCKRRITHCALGCSWDCSTSLLWLSRQLGARHGYAEGTMPGKRGMLASACGSSSWHCQELG